MQGEGGQSFRVVSQQPTNSATEHGDGVDPQVPPLDEAWEAVSRHWITWSACIAALNKEFQSELPRRPSIRATTRVIEDRINRGQSVAKKVGNAELTGGFTLMGQIEVDATLFKAGLGDGLTRKEFVMACARIWLELKSRHAHISGKSRRQEYDEKKLSLPEWDSDLHTQNLMPLSKTNGAKDIEGMPGTFACIATPLVQRCLHQDLGEATFVVLNGAYSDIFKGRDWSFLFASVDVMQALCPEVIHPQFEFDRHILRFKTMRSHPDPPLITDDSSDISSDDGAQTEASDEDCWVHQKHETGAARQFRRNLLSASARFERRYPQSVQRPVAFPVHLRRESITTKLEEKSKAENSEIAELKETIRQMLITLNSLSSISKSSNSSIRMRMLERARYFGGPRAGSDNAQQVKDEGDRAAHGPDLSADFHCVADLKQHEDKKDWSVWESRAATLYGCQWGHLTMLVEPDISFGYPQRQILLPPDLEAKICRLYWTYHFILWAVRVDPSPSLRDYVNDQTHSDRSEHVPLPIRVENLPCDTLVARRLKAEAGLPNIHIEDCEARATKAVRELLAPYLHYNKSFQKGDEAVNQVKCTLLSVESENVIILFVRLVKEAYLAAFQANNIQHFSSDRGAWKEVANISPETLSTFRSL